MRNVLLVLCLCALPAGAQNASAVNDPPGLQAAIQLSHRATGALLNGNAKPFELLFANTEDVTVSGPGITFVRGRVGLVQTLDATAANYRDGSVSSIDMVYSYMQRDLACIVEVENDRARIGGGSMVEFQMRVTSVFERVGGQWKLVHRHADPVGDGR